MNRDILSVSEVGSLSDTSVGRDELLHHAN